MRARLKPVLYLLAGMTGAALFTTTSALAGSGVGGVFNLGQTNTVNAETALSGTTGGGPQLRVENAATTQNAFGVLGRITAGSPGTQSAGVRGINSGTNGNGFGVWGFHQSGGIGVFGETPTGTGVMGKHDGSSGTTPGVDGQTASSSTGAVGVLGELTASSPASGAAGVEGVDPFPNSSGVFGESTGGIGVNGCSAPPGAPVPCSAAPEFANDVGGQFEAKAPDGIGIYSCASVTGCAVSSGSPIGAELDAEGASAVGLAVHVGGAVGEVGQFGVLTSADGVSALGGRFVSFGTGTGSIGLEGQYLGEHAQGTGVVGTTDAIDPGQIGVSGSATGTDGIGVKGEADTGSNAIGVLGSSTTGLAGRFEGNVHVTGKITRAYTSGTSNQATPIAYGFVNAAGSLGATASTPNLTSTYDSVNKRYNIAISGEGYSVSNDVTAVTPVGSSPLIATTNSLSGHLLVKIFNLNGTAVQTGFDLVVYKP